MLYVDQHKCEECRKSEHAHISVEQRVDQVFTTIIQGEPEKRIPKRHNNTSYMF